jgi:hypothetical protein
MMVNHCRFDGAKHDSEKGVFMAAQESTRSPKVIVSRQLPVLCPAPGLLPPPVSGGRLNKVPATPIPPGSTRSEEESQLSEIFTTITLDRLESLLDDNGVVAKREQVDEGEFLKFASGRFTTLILPYGEGPDFLSLQFRAGFSVSSTLEVVNAWNKDRRFGKAYLDSVGEPILEYDLDLEGGSTESTVVLAVRTFMMLVNEFASMVLEA